MSQELPKTVRLILINASQIIKTRGWCRGKLLDTDGSVCLLGAIFEAGMRRSAADFYGEQDECDAITIAAWEAVEHEINKRFGIAAEGRLTIPGWNDHPSRTDKDVLALLDAAAAVV